MNATKWGLIAVALTFAFVTANTVRAEDAPKPPKDNPPAKTDDAKPKFANPNPGKCPVTDEEIDETITAEYKGKTYAFCCNVCRKKFLKAPEDYLPKEKK